MTAAALYEQAVKPVLVFMSLYKMVWVEEVCNFSFTTLTIRVAPALLVTLTTDFIGEHASQ